MTCHVRIEAIVPDGDATHVFDRVQDYERYTDHTDTVRSVTVTPDGPDTVESAWEVHFRSGLLRWTERDVMDPVARRITFDQLTGDFASFAGTWDITQAGTDVSVLFTCEFDLGIPSLEPIINPVAMRALDESMGLILRGLLGEDIRLTGSRRDTAAAMR
ncbi:SRPBCC family protein [Streptomyces sp. NBC_01288]|uniref:type II toxin-antitoxin system RatA family toxin n=1 Tax=unclassified Streptomyces TaxID=2593676 RepID=UPI002E134F03|nr:MULTISPECIES: SRPBCC family protein [unclassified Streptomyces]WSL11684.1 SRPBCC family protein [Streptomyces sp. NBC_01288]WSW95918.1 SRPBCC family protein [Streptomyces sp. NBC_00989]